MKRRSYYNLDCVTRGVVHAVYTIVSGGGFAQFCNGTIVYNHQPASRPLTCLACLRRFL